jgi:hypothetical protein
MTSRDFCYWLQGYFEINGASKGERVMNAGQIEMVERHLSLVFKHEIDPSMPDPAGVLQAIHDGKAHIGKIGPNGEVYRC